MSEPLKYKVGDKVSVRAWDETEPEERQLGSPARVLKVIEADCASGWLYRVKGANGQELDLDQDWLRSVEG